METENGKAFKPKNKGTKVLFQNPVIEKLSRTHIAIPIAMFCLVSIGLLIYGSSNTALRWYELVLLFVAGLLTFTLVEYLVHRYLFHMETDTELKEKIQYSFHGVHHEFPKDRDRLAMPPLVSAMLCLVLFFTFRWVLGDYAYGFLPGFVLGYAAYLFVHFAVHAFQPPRNFLKVLWVNHGIHHYKNNERAFGVSSPLWDFIFRTLP